MGAASRSPAPRRSSHSRVSISRSFGRLDLSGTRQMAYRGHVEVFLAVVGVLGVSVAVFCSATLMLVYRREAVRREVILEILAAEQATVAAIDRLANIVASRDQAWFWTPEWQAGEQEADEDLAAGRGIVFKSEEEMDDYLDQVPLPHAIAK